MVMYADTVFNADPDDDRILKVVEALANPKASRRVDFALPVNVLWYRYNTPTETVIRLNERRNELYARGRVYYTVARRPRHTR